MNDYATLTAADTVRIERTLPGPVERVWRYLTDAELRGQWFASGPMEQQAGGKAELTFRNSELTENDDPAPAKYARESGEMHMSSRILECEPPHLLVMTFGGGEVPSEVRFELRAVGGNTQLIVTHSRLSSRGAILSVSGGWHTHLEILIAKLEGRTPPGFWRTHTKLEAEYAKRLG